jgi:hypothetical protein
MGGFSTRFRRDGYLGQLLGDRGLRIHFGVQECETERSWPTAVCLARPGGCAKSVETKQHHMLSWLRPGIE